MCVGDPGAGGCWLAEGASSPMAPVPWGQHLCSLGTGLRRIRGIASKPRPMVDAIVLTSVAVVVRAWSGTSALLR